MLPHRSCLIHACHLEGCRVVRAGQRARSTVRGHPGARHPVPPGAPRRWRTDQDAPGLHGLRRGGRLGPARQGLRGPGRPGGDARGRRLRRAAADLGPRDRRDGVRTGRGGRPDAVRQDLLPRARGAHRQALRAAARGARAHRADGGGQGRHAAAGDAGGAAGARRRDRAADAAVAGRDPGRRLRRADGGRRTARGRADHGDVAGRVAGRRLRPRCLRGRLRPGGR